MHEMALTNGVLRILEAEAARQNFNRVLTVWLEVGALSHADPEALRFCFEAAAHGTVAEGAKLVIQEPEGRGWCMDCAKTVTLAARGEPCPDCGGYKLQVTGGDSLRVLEMEVA